MNSRTFSLQSKCNLSKTFFKLTCWNRSIYIFSTLQFPKVVSKQNLNPLTFFTPYYPKINKKKLWKLTSQTVTKCPQWYRGRSGITALTWAAPKSQCACLDSTETWSEVAKRNFPPFFLLFKKTGQEWRVGRQRKGEKEKKSSRLAWTGSFPSESRSPLHSKCLSLGLDSQMQSWAGAERGKNSQIEKLTHQFDM